ncbi:MAG: DUF5984 family protein [Flavobacterium sp.]
MINFKLKNLNEIVPVGQEPNQNLSWFWLTDGELWFNFENIIIYEYTPEALNYFGDKLSPYNDYYIVRFIEDFTQLFDKISEVIPEKFYAFTKTIEEFKTNSKKWLDVYDTNENSDFYFDEFYKLMSWINERTLYSGHLIGGPNLSFFRQNDKVRIIWQTEYVLENGINLWTAKNGSCEINYIDFVNEIKIFGERFFAEMDKQIESTLAKNFENIQLNKKRLVDEHQERKDDFWNAFKILEHESVVKTDWEDIEKVYTQMVTEIK